MIPVIHWAVLLDSISGIGCFCFSSSPGNAKWY